MYVICRNYPTTLLYKSENDNRKYSLTYTGVLPERNSWCSPRLASRMPRARYSGFRQTILNLLRQEMIIDKVIAPSRRDVTEIYQIRLCGHNSIWFICFVSNIYEIPDFKQSFNYSRSAQLNTSLGYFRTHLLNWLILMRVSWVVELDF